MFKNQRLKNVKNELINFCIKQTHIHICSLLPFGRNSPPDLLHMIYSMILLDKQTASCIQLMHLFFVHFLGLSMMHCIAWSFFVSFSQTSFINHVVSHIFLQKIRLAIMLNVANKTINVYI